MMRTLLAALALLASACRCGDSSAKKDSNMVGDTTRSNWPAAPAPNLPAELADLAWPPPLAELQRAGLVTCTRVGQWSHYRRDEEAIAALGRKMTVEV